MFSHLFKRCCTAGPIAGLIVLGGCTSMSGIGGSPEFHCPAPQGIPCRSMSEVDQALRSGQGNTAGPRTAPSGYQQGAGDLESREAAPRAGEGALPSRSSMPRYLPASATIGEDEATLGAIRSDPTVIRIWIAPYEDTDGDLHEASRVYLQIDNGRWLIQHNQDRIRKEFAPKPSRVAAVRPTTTATAVEAPSRPADLGSGAGDQALANAIKEAAHVR